MFDQVLSILRTLVQPSRRARIATAGTEESWAVDPRHCGVGALRFKRWMPVEAWRSVLIHGGNLDDFELGFLRRRATLRFPELVPPKARGREKIPEKRESLATLNRNNAWTKNADGSEM